MLAIDAKLFSHLLENSSIKKLGYWDVPLRRDMYSNCDPGGGMSMAI
jgi:hypothetical protein